jgi:hypothetical protein
VDILGYFLGSTEGRPHNSPSPTAMAENAWDFISKPLTLQAEVYKLVSNSKYFKVYAN